MFWLTLLPLLAVRCSSVGSSDNDFGEYGEDYTKYGNKYSCRFSEQADFLEFTPLHSRDHLPRILWNRADPEASGGGRGQVVERNLWEMMDVTQADNGDYTFKKKDKSWVTWRRLTVTENTISYGRAAEDTLHITYALDPAVCTVTFTPFFDPTSDHKEMEAVVMKAGKLIAKAFFSGRIRKLPSSVPKLGFEIRPLRVSDGGFFKIRDQNGNLALVVELTVYGPTPPKSTPQLSYTAIGFLVIFTVVVCWCCVRRWRIRRWRNRACLSHITVIQPAATPDLHDDDASQSSASSYSASLHHEPTPPEARSLHHEPTPPEARSLEPPTYEECVASDPGPRFELRGVTFPSAPPLSPDSTHSDVYTSDRFNFL